MPWLAPVVVLALVVGVAWFGWTHYVTSQVRVAWTGLPACTGTSPEITRRWNDDPDDPDEPPIVVVPVTREMRCTITAEVVNDSPADVDVEQVLGRLLGPEAATVVQAATGDGRGVRWSADRLDAVYAGPGELGGHDRTTVEVAFAWRPDGCSAGVLASAPDLPEVTVSVLGRERTITPADVLHLEVPRDLNDCSPDARTE